MARRGGGIEVRIGVMQGVHGPQGRNGVLRPVEGVLAQVHGQQIDRRPECQAPALRGQGDQPAARRIDRQGDQPAKGRGQGELGGHIGQPGEQVQAVLGRARRLGRPEALGDQAHSQHGPQGPCEGEGQEQAGRGMVRVHPLGLAHKPYETVKSAAF